MTSSLIEALPGPTGVPEMAAGQHTLARNSVHLTSVLFLAIATMAPGVGEAFSVPAGAPFAGSAMAGSVVIALFGCLFVSVAIAELAERIPSAGGMATYIGRAFHGGAGFISGWGYSLIYVLAIGYLGLLSGDLLGSSMPAAFGGTYNGWAVVGSAFTLGVTFAMQYYGLRYGARIGVVLGLIEIVIVLLLSICMIVAAGDNNTLTVFYHNASPGTGYSTGVGMFAGSIFAFLAFVGFDAAAPLGEEAVNPRKTVKQAVILSTVLIGVFYIIATYATVVYFGPEKYSKFQEYGEGNPWGALAEQLWGVSGRFILLIAFLNSSIACSNGCATAVTRTIWAMGRSGTLPRALSYSHPKWRSPVVSICLVMAVGAALVIGFGSAFGAVAGYTWIGTAQSIGILPIYVLVAIACPVYILRHHRSEFRVFKHLILPALGVVCIVPTFFAGAGIPVASFISPLAYPLNLAGPAVGVFWLAGIVLLIFHQRRNPSTLHAMAHVFEDPSVEAVPVAAE
jgi:amino acid transporter